MPTITAIVSDTHIGSYTGLSLHEWNCDTGLINQKGEPIYQKYQATIAQDWLYEKWLDFWKHVKKLAGKKNRIVAIHLGDTIDGFHPNYIQAIPNISDQKNMAVEILKPIVNMSDSFQLIRGTGCHGGKAAQHEFDVAKELGIPCLWEGLFDIDGLIIDCAHHGKVGKQPWTSAAANQAEKAIHDATTDKPPRTPPRYVFRGHMHMIDDSGDKVEGTRCIVLPSWELRNELGHRLEPGIRADIGGVIILPDGSLDLSKLRYYAAPGQRKIVKI